MAAAGAGAAALMLSSAALACTAYLGKLQVQGGGGTSTAVGNGQGHGYCDSTGGANPTGGATAPTSGGAITVSVSPSPYCLNNVMNPANLLPQSNRLPAGAYEVNFINYGVEPSTGQSNPGFTITGRTYTEVADCMSNGPYAASEHLLGVMVVDANGNGSGSYTIPGGLIANTRSDASAVCVSGGGPLRNNWGNQAPIAII